jgi:acyl CoA:acetate/3-ketoacid CoA transferase beta subunit
MGTITELMRKPVIVRFVTIPDMFSNLEGGIIDIAALGFLQVDRQGNVNPSILSDRIYGPGGFPDIAGGPPKTYFAGAFTASQKKFTLLEAGYQLYYSIGSEFDIVSTTLCSLIKRYTSEPGSVELITLEF